MSRPILIQLGLFGGFTEIANMHTVAAHTRVRADGSEVFVGEHLRWNTGRQAAMPRPARPDPTPPESHPSLFDWTGPSGEPEPLEAPSPLQLDLWA